MLITKNYRDSLYFKYNVDSQGNPISIKIEDEFSQVSPLNYSVHMVQIPDEKYRVVVQDEKGKMLYEVFDVEELGVDNFKVDYAHGVIYFNPVHSGKTMILNYYGRGVEMIHASRVLLDYITGDNLGNLIGEIEAAFTEVERLKELIAEVKKDYDEWKSLIYADQPLLALQAQIKLMNADGLDHVRWRENSTRDGIITHENHLITNDQDEYLIRTEV